MVVREDVTSFHEVNRKELRATWIRARVDRVAVKFVEGHAVQKRHETRAVVDYVTEAVLISEYLAGTEVDNYQRASEAHQ